MPTSSHPSPHPVSAVTRMTTTEAGSEQEEDSEARKAAKKAEEQRRNEKYALIRWKFDELGNDSAAKAALNKRQVEAETQAKLGNDGPLEQLLSEIRADQASKTAAASEPE